MKVSVGHNRVHITVESLIWFTALTAIGTVVGGVVYSALLPYLPTWAGGTSGEPAGTPPENPNPIAE